VSPKWKSVFIRLLYPYQTQDTKKKHSFPLHYCLLLFVIFLIILPGNDHGSDDVVFPFTKYLLTNCEAFESDVSLRDTAVAASNEPRVNTFDFLNRKKGILASMVMLIFSSLLSIKLFFEGHKYHLPRY
jgi:hypothetical protein